MAKDTWIDAHTEPKGKRSVRRNNYGILRGYIGRTSWETISGGGASPFSEAEAKVAAAWVAGREDWREAAWEN